MRRGLVLLVAAATLGGCGSSVDRAEVTRLQDEVDSAARIVAITTSEALTATLPAGTTLGTGRSTTCSATPGDASDRVTYSVDFVVTHDPMDAVAALRQVASELRREGYDARYVADAGVVRADVGDAEAEISADGPDLNPTAHRVVVDTGCVDVGADLAAELVQEPGRDVRR